MDNYYQFPLYINCWNWQVESANPVRIIQKFILIHFSFRKNLTQTYKNGVVGDGERDRYIVVLEMKTQVPIFWSEHHRYFDFKIGKIMDTKEVVLVP